MKVHHVGYLVKNMEKAQEKMKLMGYSLVQNSIYDEYRKVDIAFLEKDAYVVELVAPAAEDSAVSELYKRYRNSPYHLCYATTHFETDRVMLTKNGFVQIGEPCPAPAIGNKRVVFFMNAAIGMVELLEE